MAPCVKEDSNSRRSLSFLSYLALLIWPLFNYICNCFDWDNTDVINTAENETSAGAMIVENFNVDYDNSHNTKDSSNYNFAGSVLKDQFHQFGKDVQDKLDLLKNELQQKFEAEFEALFARVKKVNELDSQCPGIQKLVKEEDFQSEKKAVENCLKDETFQDLKKQEDLFERKNDARKYPKISQCAGGNGNNSASKTEVKVAKENKPCNQATASPTGNGCGKNGEGFGDDGNDPPEKKFSCLKPHYLDIVVPKKSRQNDKFQESSYKESHPEESHLEAMPYQETPDLSSNENRSGPSDSNQSKDVEMDILEPLDMNVVTLSDSKDDKCDDSNNQGLDILTGSKSNMCEASQEQSGNIQETTTDGGFDKMEVDASCLPGLHILPGSKNNRHEPLHGQSGNEPATAVGSKMQVDPSYHLEMNAGETSHFQIGNKPDETIKNGPSALDSYRPLPYTILLQFDPVLNIHGKDGLYKHHRDFTILRVIDRGKFGVCYEIEDLASRKKFALKKIKSRDFDLIELEIWSKIRPTHVITPLGAYDDGNDVYIFMELMDGTFKFIGHNREALGLTEERIAALIKPILECLDLIHREKWVHADIKPENTFFGHNCVKLGDFGLAVNLLTQNKKYGLRGTAPYMSPEICREEGYGTSADIYAAACLVLYLLTGSHPWKDFGMGTIIYQVRCDKIPEIPNNCPERLKRLLQRMLNPDHRVRPTAKELLKDKLFSNLQEEVLQEVLFDIEQLQRKAVRSQENEDMAFSPTTFDDNAAGVEETIHALPL